MGSFDFNKINFDYDKDYEQEMTPVMIRQKHKTQLIMTTNYQLEQLSRDKLLYGRKYKKATNDILRDYFLGVKKINKKNPVFIEMPQLKAVANGQIKKEYEKSYEKEEYDDEILVNMPDTVLIEDKK